MNLQKEGGKEACLGDRIWENDFQTGLHRDTHQPHSLDSPPPLAQLCRSDPGTGHG